jgi:pimeloyl-ACP methyl ester carboxylesterase
VIAPDPPGHGGSPVLPPESYRPSALAGLGADLLAALGVARATFMGFSWGGRIACSFGACFPERAAGLALIDGGYLEWADIPGVDTGADLETCVAQARRGFDDDSFASWNAYFDFERESLGRWTPALAEAHRAAMREADGRVVPILGPDAGGAIRHGEFQEPVPETYPLIRAAGIPVLLLTAPEQPKYQAEADAAIARFRAALPDARVVSMPDAIHDLVSYAPAEVAALVGEFAIGQPPP